VAEGWRSLHNEELNFYSAPNVIRAVKSRRMKWAEHVVRMGKMRNASKFLSENLKESDHSEERRRSEDNIRMDLRGIG
jgi:hypothetical protein